MSRFIKFRGFCKEDWEWHYGDLITWLGAADPQIKDWNTENFKDFDVDCESVGQFTGFLDKNGVQLFEGDLVETEKGTLVVKYNERTGGVVFAENEGENSYSVTCFEAFEIVGNSYNDVDATKRLRGSSETKEEKQENGCIVTDRFGRYLMPNLYRWSMNRNDAQVFKDENEAKSLILTIWSLDDLKIVSI